MVRSSRALALVATALAVATTCRASAQTAGAPYLLQQIEVTADRVPQPLDATGSDVTVIPGARIQEWGAQGITEVLREVVGVSVTQTAGPGSTTKVRLRGADPGEALVMIDGIPIGNAAGTDGSVDFGNLTALDIDRIEIVRGPQSALYGSDAMAGVINIITRRGSATGAPSGSAYVEGGSYGSLQARGSVSGTSGPWSCAAGVEFMHTDGFPAFGYRIDRPITLEDGVTPLPALPSIEPSQKGAVSGRIGYRISPTVRLEGGYDVFGNSLYFANPYVDTPSDVFSPYNLSKTWIGNGFIRAIASSPDGVFGTRLTLFGNVTEEDVRETEACTNAAYVPFDCTNAYRGTRWGVESQSEVEVGPLGTLVFGARNLNEGAETNENPNPNDGSFAPVSATQVTNSGFVEDRLTLFRDLDLTAGGRIDAVEDSATFETGRITADLPVAATGTKLRAAFGDGAKVATLYQRFSAYGTPGLAPQRNVGGEVGIDQKLARDRLAVAATAFDADYTDLIGFADVPSCTAAQAALGGCYYNVGHARTRGIEASIEATIVPRVLTARAEYTYTDAQDTVTRTEVLRVPPQQGALSLDWFPRPRLDLQPRLLLVGPQHDDDPFIGQTVTLPGYVRLDLIARYRVAAHLTAELRLENLTDGNDEEVYDYGSAGRSIYGGLETSL